MSIISIFKHIFFPTRCICCGKTIDVDCIYCDNCQNKLPRVQIPICLNCANSESDCFCGKKKHHYKSIIAPFYYEGVIMDAIKRFKFANMLYISDGLAKEVSDMAQKVYLKQNIDIVCFVPMSKSGYKKRGFNQSEILAEKISKNLGAKLERKLLIKTYDNQAQHFLKASLRAGNVLGVYECKDNVDIMNKNILLIDDVKTTGATLDECAKMLKLNGANEVYCACCVVVRGKNKSNI